MKTMQDLINAAKQQKPRTLVVAVADDEPVLKSVEMARKEGFIKPLLFGDQAKIEAVLHKIKAPVDAYDIIHETDMIKTCAKAVGYVHDHDDAFLMKGLVDTATILKAALSKEKGLRTNRRISHVSVFETSGYHKLLLMSDGAMNITPNVDEKQEIIDNAVQVALAIGIQTPAVGMIAAVEKVNPKMQATLDAQTLKDRQTQGMIKNCIVDGPFAIDNAINKEAARHKGITSSIAGDVDILLMPMIEAGNVFYKTMMFLAGAKSASVIAGAKKPIVLTSRADSEASKFYSIALSALMVK